ncbi:MAG: NAD(P)-dependent oxidoreductase [Candidatus Omnitrophota bacterium]|nr:NAD(P)-dependent oxidoreductase [Candidatus Omnitrophota bacterium]
MKTIVFGGSGFLGSYLAEALVAAGYEVTIFDLKGSGLDNVNMVIGDITDAPKVREAITGADIVYNLAAIADIDECVKNPVEAVKYNILGNTVILNECAKAKKPIKRFVYASSVYVYSSSGGFYRSTKQASESIIENYNKYYGIPYTIVRYGTPYGPMADEKNSVYRFIKDACEKGKMQYVGVGTEVREYIHASDAARLSVKILDAEYENQRVMLTGHHPVKVSDLLMMINEILGGKIGIEYLGKKKDVPERHYTITPYSYNPRIAKKLVDHYYLDLGQGLLDCVEKFKSKEVGKPFTEMKK